MGEGGGVAFNAIKQQDAVTSGTLAHLNWELISSTKNIKSLHIQSKDEVDDVYFTVIVVLSTFRYSQMK